MEGQNWQEASIFVASHDSSKNLPPGISCVFCAVKNFFLLIPGVLRHVQPLLMKGEEHKASFYSPTAAKEFILFFYVLFLFSDTRSPPSRAAAANEGRGAQGVSETSVLHCHLSQPGRCSGGSQAVACCGAQPGSGADDRQKKKVSAFTEKNRSQPRSGADYSDDRQPQKKKPKVSALVSVPY